MDALFWVINLKESEGYDEANDQWGKDPSVLAQLMQLLNWSNRYLVERIEGNK